MKWLIGENIAHRGYHDKENGIPENSMMAFKRAIENQFPIEIDIHLLKNGEVIVFHDDNLKRMTGLDMAVRECEPEILKELTLDSTENKIPTLREVLELTSDAVPLLIEFKNDAPEDELEAAAMKILAEYKGRYAVQSFRLETIKWFKENHPEIPRGVLVSGNIKKQNSLREKIILKHLWLKKMCAPDFIAYNIKNIPNKALDRQKRQGMPVFGWTARSKEEYDEAEKYCSSVIFEGDYEKENHRTI